MTKIGKFCSIAKNVRTIAGKHPITEFVSQSPYFYAKDLKWSFVKKQKFAEFGNPIEDNFLITIGNDVWIGESAMIMEGVKIGDGAIIGAGSLVLKNVPPYAIVAGVPAKIIKYRFSEEEINKLLEIQWWNKSIEWIKENVDLYENISMFLNSQNVL